MTKNDVLWAQLVAGIPIDFSKPKTCISKEDIERVIGRVRDLRLLMSMDSERKLATVLKDNGFFVLPRTRNEWCVVRGRGYAELKEPTTKPVHFESRSPTWLTKAAYGDNETGFLYHAMNSGILNDFAGEELFPTVGGKEGTSSFHLKVDGHTDLDVDGAQMEIDLGLRGKSSRHLYEAKVGWPGSFIIRQLYYPYRSYLGAQERPATVRSNFFVAEPEKASYVLWQFKWRDDDDYEAIDEIKSQRYFIDDKPPTPGELTDIGPDPDVPFFQADSIEKVLRFPFLIPQGITSAKAWAALYGHDTRQGQYYRAAAEGLGLVSKSKGVYSLTEQGREFVTQTPPERSNYVAQRLLQSPVFNALFDLAQKRGAEGVGKEDVSRSIKERTGLTGSTPARRASSVLSYFKWLGQTTGTVVVEGQRLYSREGWGQRPAPAAGRN